jgi:type VI protein secretion system component VasK
MNDPNYDSMNGQPQSNGMAVAALVIGIISMILAIIPVVGFLSWIGSPLAAILGFVALRRGTSRGLAIGGIVTGIIGLIICILWAALFVWGASVAGDPAAMEQFQQSLEQNMTPEEREEFRRQMEEATQGTQ